MATLTHQRTNVSTWTKLYTETGKLPQSKVGCNTCSNYTTLFGDNLIKRVARFGTIKLLLETFKCRFCLSDTKPDGVQRAVIVDRKPRKKRTDTKVAREEALMVTVSSMKHTYRTTTVDLVKNASECAVTTKGSCFHPNLYLDNGRFCNGCALFDNCACAIKKLKR